MGYPLENPHSSRFNHQGFPFLVVAGRSPLEYIALMEETMRWQKKWLWIGPLWLCTIW